jgi:hypothetical protein
MQDSRRPDAQTSPRRSSYLIRSARKWALLGVAALITPGFLGCAGPQDATPTPRYANAPVASWRLNGVGLATLVAGNTVYVAGTFTTATSPDGRTVANRVNLAAFSATTGALLTSFRADADDAVRTLAYDGKNLYVGGSFMQINGVPRSHLAALDPATGAVRTAWQADATSNVYGLSVAAGKLFVAGSFSTFKNMPRERLAAVKLSDASVTPFAPAADGTVNTIAVASDASAVYVGGNYTSINGIPTTHLTKLARDGSVVAVPWETVGGPALGLEVTADGTRVAVAIAGEPDTNPGANQGALFDTTTGRKVWVQRCNGDGQAIHILSDTVYTGFHRGCAGDTTIRLTKNNISTGSRDLSFIPAFDQFWGVWAISGSSTALVVAGDFTKISGVAVQGFAVFPHRD